MDKAGQGGGEEEKTVALCGAGNLASTRCGEEGSGLCVKHPFSGTPLDWVFQHWSPRNVTSRHNDCLTKRAVGERAIGKQARKYSLMSFDPPAFCHIVCAIY
jgi:hypothetical protein